MDFLLVQVHFTTSKRNITKNKILMKFIVLHVIER